ncbi:hypothetical protein Gohar_015673 [Gossypium harknessii]|uniref:Uncharacterized protein n=1 Tax=Gossypium harknessii TaxID=34285 RepID=A0A7J9G0N8_9ROSI|nr:hypothetical protein [Gossypium harknessii]
MSVVHEAKKFRTSGIDPNFEGKLDQMFIGIVATSDKAWAPFSGTLPSEFFEDTDNAILEENEEENVIKKKSSKQIRGAATLSSPIEKIMQCS